MSERKDEVRLTRREVIKTSAFLGGAAMLAGGADRVFNELRTQVQNEDVGGQYTLARPENILYSSCLNCTVSCAIKVKIQDGVVAKIDGSPYSAMNMLPNITNDTPPTEVAVLEGKLCPKGQAGIQTCYDPYRLRKVLKRAGPRGSGKWQTIDFDTAVKEIVHGGKLFAHLGEDRVVPGLKEIAALKDAKVAADMAADVALIRQKKLTVAEFKQKHAANLQVLINPDHPDLGPKNNQFIFQCGRIHNGRIEFSKRFVNAAMGSVNWIEKTTLCGQTFNRASMRTTANFVDGKWTGGTRTPRPDHANTEFLLVVGTIPFEAQYGPVQQSEPITEGLRSGRLKLCVVDPRLTKIASKAWKWLPIKTGADAPFFLAMIHWIIENERYDKRYLTNANRAAANADKEPAFSNATWLVKIEDGRPTMQVRASELGLGKADEFVVLSNGKPVAVRPGDDKNPVEGELFVDTTVGGFRVKSALQLLKEEAASRTMAQWAELTGLDEKDIIAVAREFTSHGKKAALEAYRGTIKHTNGWNAMLTAISLNMLIGNYDAVGGITRPGGQHEWRGTKTGQPFDVAKMHPGRLASFGVTITREGWRYEESTLFKGYPAHRPWYPYSNDVAQETFPSIADGYPYPAKALLMAVHTTLYAVPNGTAQIKTFLDPDKLPLFVACDIVIGDTSMYADYIFPDVTYLEQFGITQGSHHSRVRSSGLRQPVITPLTEKVMVAGEETHLSLETMMTAIAIEAGLSGFGKNAMGEGMHLIRPEDWYLKLHVNVAYDGKHTPDASAEDMALFATTHRHLAPSVFSEERWKKTVRPQDWPKLVWLLNRGGRFEAAASYVENGAFKNKMGGINRFYLEEIAMSKNSMTGKFFVGAPAYLPIVDSMGKPIPEDEGEFTLITYKEVTITQSRTVSNYWAQLAVSPENYVVISAADARRLGIRDGDTVRLTSRSNPAGVLDLGNGRVKPVQGKARVTETIRPGVVGVSTGFGHWAYGSADVEVDGMIVPGDSRRGTGIHCNPLFRLDDHLRGTPLTEPIGGSTAWFDTRVNIQKVLG